MDMNSIMSSQLKSLQSAVQMSVLNKSLSMSATTATAMLQSLPDQAVAVHPAKGTSIDVSV